jgi:hypothetical protein
MKIGSPGTPIFAWKVELHEKLPWANACPGIMPSIRISRMPMTEICGIRNLEKIDNGTFILPSPNY